VEYRSYTYFAGMEAVEGSYENLTVGKGSLLSYMTLLLDSNKAKGRKGDGYWW
jgi:hypothetical protein